jgi:hypothetical protein
MQSMARALLAALVAAGLAGAGALAQGVAPGGPIGGSTGIGSGLGGVIGTGPNYPNGTPAGPTRAPPIPPGGYPPVGHFDNAPGAPNFGRSTNVTPPPVTSTSRYPQPQEPFTTPLPQPREAAGAAAGSAPVLKLPSGTSTDPSFLDGCWHTDLFRYGPASTSGVATYCFDDKGAGRLLYRRVSDPGYFCRGPAQARYDGKGLHITNTDTSCTDGDRSYPATLDCTKSADGVAQCGGEAWAVQLHFVGARASR